ncbi:hypothetical protein BDQ12DRAFT_748219 [Crucibulum laeve]|uniref:Uncharacterized protein n=1 Tax=Crucibulum laeve TaxID=68775 RepID=A0A5C3LH62_9AGAR|nr:hypothetical protein BDQ12DRAFT_748219 [Crucibulum laeve]
MSLLQRSPVPSNSDVVNPATSAPTISSPITSTRGLATSVAWPFPVMSPGAGPWDWSMHSAFGGGLQGTPSVSTTASISLSNPTSLASSISVNAPSVTSQNTKQTSSQLRAAQIAGICVGVLFLLIISLFIIRRCLIRMAQKRQHLTPLVFPNSAIPNTQPPKGSLRPFTKGRTLEEAVDVDRPRPVEAEGRQTRTTSARYGTSDGENDAGSQIAGLQLQMQMLLQSLAVRDGIQQSGVSSRSESPPEYAPRSLSA